MTSNRYTATAIALHWLLAALIAGQIAFGLMLRDVPRGTPARGFYVNLHKSTGLAIWALVLVRLGWRLRHPAPELPRSVGRTQRLAARATHVALYATLLTVPLAGYLASNFSKHGVLLFNAVRLPPWGPDQPHLYRLFNDAHIVIGWMLAALVALHVAAALLHAWRRDGAIDRMVPGLGVR